MFLYSIPSIWIIHCIFQISALLVVVIAGEGQERQDKERELHAAKGLTLEVNRGFDKDF